MFLSIASRQFFIFPNVGPVTATLGRLINRVAVGRTSFVDFSGSWFDRSSSLCLMDQRKKTEKTISDTPSMPHICRPIDPPLTPPQLIHMAVSPMRRVSVPRGPPPSSGAAEVRVPGRGLDGQLQWRAGSLCQVGVRAGSGKEVGWRAVGRLGMFQVFLGP